jgi:hypothetical protein
MRRILFALCLLMPGLAAAQNYPMSGGQNFQARFAAANTTHDGHLTLAQAQAAGLRMIVRHFSEIDTQNKGYITLADIQAWRSSHPEPMRQPPAPSD